MKNARWNGICLGTTLVAAAFGISCASPFPAVLTSNPDQVSIEFAIDGSLAEATKLASQECEKLGKVAEFTEVKKDATPDSRVAQFKCIDATPAAPAPAESAPAEEAPAEDAPAEDASAEEAPASDDAAADAATSENQ